ncbi:MAG: VOC family protein [Terracidiphilus sp.]
MTTTVTRIGRVAAALLLLAMAASGWAGASQDGAKENAVDPAKRMSKPALTLAHVCLITGDVQRLVDFYEAILGVKATWSGPDYAELATNDSTAVAIFSFAAQQRYIPDVTEAAHNRSVILEFQVADVDSAYSQLQRGVVKTWVKGPTTQPWGTRSIYFRDPDGNLVDFFMPAKVR